MKRHLSLAWLLLGSTLILTPFNAFLKTDSGRGEPANEENWSIQTPQGGATTFTVTNNGDLGIGSLRNAIDLANLSPGADVIDFIAGIGTINVGGVAGQGLPAITEAVTIDAGSSRVELNGASAGPAFGLQIVASGVTVRGLAINRFELAGISIEANNCIIENNFIGTDATGTAALPNLQGGITIGGQGNLIGGIVAGAGNIIAHNTARGVHILSGGNNAVLGNSIFDNGIIGIALSDDPGITPNDLCDDDGGANGLQNFPVLTSASSGDSTTIVGTLESTLGTTFRIEFFSSPNCEGSGIGEGQTFIGATTVNIPSNACVVSINSTFPVSVPIGRVITATATDSSNNTSGFSRCLFVDGITPCALTCPSDLIAFTAPTTSSCGAVVTFTPQVSGDCQVSCVPPSGSVFAVGNTPVVCTSDSGSSCTFNVTVVDQTPPRLECSTGVSAQLPAGQSSVVVNYPAPTASDNCSTTSVVCVPPSGSAFPRGATLVACTARDTSENANRCFFFVTVLDGQPAVITCPANVSVVPPAGQTSAVVNYPPPTVTDNFPGTTVICSPASGSSFPLGTTTVVCTATDADGNRSTCSFSVGVGGPQARVTIPGNRTSLEFAANPTRKPPKPAKNPCGFFTIDNIGFAPLALTVDSLRRTGSDVTSGRISDPNDVNGVPETTPTKFFTLFRVNADQSLTQLTTGQALTLIQPGQSQQFCVKFAALIPGLAGKTSGLAATDVLPSLLTSTLTFRQNGGANIDVPIQARVSTGLVLVNLTNRRAAPEVLFTKSGDDITVSYAVFDSNLDVSRATYEFLDSSGQVVAGPFEIDLTASISSANLVRGQTFSVDQRFTGANSNPNVTSVRLTVFDGETSAGAPSASATSLSAATIHLMNSVRRITLYPPVLTLR